MGQGVLRAVRYASDASGWHDIVISTNVETVVGLIYRGCSRLRRLMLIESNYIYGLINGQVTGFTCVDIDAARDLRWGEYYCGL
jgi:hypothetical protein